MSEDEVDNSALLTEKAALNNFVEKAALNNFVEKAALNNFVEKAALVVMTKSEYDNLTDEEKNKDIFYFIKE